MGHKSAHYKFYILSLMGTLLLKLHKSLQGIEDKDSFNRPYWFNPNLAVIANVDFVLELGA